VCQVRRSTSLAGLKSGKPDEKKFIDLLDLTVPRTPLYTYLMPHYRYLTLYSEWVGRGVAPAVAQRHGRLA